MNKPFFTGVCTALVTPFLENRVNYPMLEILLQRQLEAGIRAIVLCGTTGEASTLSDGEKIEMIRRGKNFVGKRCKIIAGTGSNDTSHAVRLSQAAESAGADALLVVSPYYNKATTEGLVAHYMAIAGSVKIPVILYNVPSRTGLDVPVSVYQQLSLVPNIVGVKEANTDIRKIMKIRRTCGQDFAVWSGNDDMTVPVVSLGGRGVISVLSNVCPVEMAAMTNAALDGDFDSAAALQLELDPLSEALFSEVNPIPVKAAMKLIGYDCGGCRLPLTELDQTNLQRLQELFR